MVTGNPIENSLTRQGGSQDVSSFFDINSLIGGDFTADQLRSVVSSSWLCQKVVGFIPKEMVNVQFGLSLTGQSARSRSIQDLTVIQDQLRRLMPWFGECQKRANIVGKSYLIIQARGFSYDDIIEAPEDILVPEETPDDEDIDSDIEFTDRHSAPDQSNQASEVRNGLEVNTLEGVTRRAVELSMAEKLRRRRRNQVSVKVAGMDFGSAAPDSGIPIDQLIARFPYTFPIDYSNFLNMQIAGVDIVDCDQYKWSKSKRFLYRARPSAKKIKEEEIDVRSTITKWFNADPDGETNELEIIHRSHVIEFTAFDYQAPPEKSKGGAHEPDGYGSLCGSGNCGGGIKQPSFRLTRFITALLYFDSFVNSVLNRTHRSEFIAYRKENLGDTNLELARLAANNDFSHPSVAAPILDPEDAIMRELQTVANSALNLGVVLVDKTSELNMVARSFTGIQNVHDVFRPLVIGASGLTEFTLMGLTMASAGLNSHDVRDRMAIAGQVDILFRDTWQPMLEELANTIATSYTNFPTFSYLSLKAGASFKLTELEISDVLDKMITTRIALVENAIISREELRAELKGDGLLGKYFVITDPEKATQREIALNIELLGRYNQQGTTPQSVIPVTEPVESTSKVRTGKLNVKLKNNK